MALKKKKVRSPNLKLLVLPTPTGLIWYPPPAASVGNLF